MTDGPQSVLESYSPQLYGFDSVSPLTTTVNLISSYSSQLFALKKLW